MKCNLIVPGFAKSGTSSLHAYLDQHPSICMSSVKEPHFFSSERNYSRGVEWHDSLFESCAKKASWYGESSTSYAVWEPALNRIKERMTNPKFIVLVRHPVERLLSHYRWMYAIGLENQPLADAIENELSCGYDFETGGRKGNYPWYLRHSRYSYFGGKLTEIFGSENVLFLRSEELLQRPEIVLRYCCEFLGVDALHSIKRIEVNQTKEKRVQRTLGVHRLLQNLPSRIRNVINRQETLLRIVKGALGSYRRVAPVPREQDIIWLKDELAEDIEFFKKMPSAESLGYSGADSRESALSHNAQD